MGQRDISVARDTTQQPQTRMVMITVFPTSPDTQFINIAAIFTSAIPVCPCKARGSVRCVYVQEPEAGERQFWAKIREQKTSNRRIKNYREQSGKKQNRSKRRIKH